MFVRGVVPNENGFQPHLIRTKYKYIFRPPGHFGQVKPTHVAAWRWVRTMIGRFAEFSGVFSFV